MIATKNLQININSYNIWSLPITPLMVKSIKTLFMLITGHTLRYNEGQLINKIIVSCNDQTTNF